MLNFTSQRKQLLETLYHSGIHDEKVLSIVAQVPRELFVNQDLRHLSYENQALPLSLGQTISQPFIVAIMTQALALTGQERVLEIGTGSGYQAAILSYLTKTVYTVERHAQLSQQAEKRIAQLQRSNVRFRIGDGTLGWVEEAPFERILVTAAAPQVPGQLVQQLTMGGWLVIPIGAHDSQELQIIQRVPEGIHIKSLGRCVFVPLIGEEGWREQSAQ